MTGQPGIDIGALGDQLGGRFDSRQGMGWVGGAEADKDLVVLFYRGTVHNAFQSEKQGVAVYDPCDYLKIYFPGEPSMVYCQPVRPQDKQRFRRQWEDYSAGVIASESGTPLSVLWPHRPELCKHLEGTAHITTVQQLATLSDSALQNLQFGRELSNQAKKYLETAERGAAYHELNSELSKRDQQIAALTTALAELRNQVGVVVPVAGLPVQLSQTDLTQAHVEQPAKRGPGRPRKVAAAAE